MSEITNELYKDFIYKKPDTKSNVSASNRNNTLERTPSGDKFELQNSKNINFKANKNKLIRLGVGVIGASIAAAGFFCGKKTNEKLISNYANEIQKLTSAHNGEIEKLQQQIEALTNKGQSEERAISEAIESILSSSDKTTAIKEKFMAQYMALLEKAELSYDYTSAPAEKIYEKTDWAKIFKIEELTPLKGEQKTLGELLNIPKLKEKLSREGKISLVIPSDKKIEAVMSKEAFIDGKTIANLGQVVDSEMTTAYGKRINWSEEKIARDIMQNFYDGHGHTLDGVQVFMEKLPNGKTKVKISGKGFYEYTNLQLLGSGNKCENPYNAGGFGEGTKVLVANLLGKGDTSKVTYSCADWKLSFCSPKEGNNIIRRKLEKAPEILEGNSIEFETENQKLVDSIIESINYFKHSQNPDFEKLTYDSEDFAFRFLGKGKGGNIYLTQRFEFEGSGNWEGNVDGLNLIFKRKPDPEKYKKLTGKDLPKDRDRTCLTFEDVENLTRYFAHEMSDEELMASILSTKSAWGKINPYENKSALISFLSGLIEEASQRISADKPYNYGLKLNVGKEKFVAVDVSNDNVINCLQGYGYEFLPKFFEKIGIDTTSKVYKQMSVHKSLEPTEIEIKKLKLLEEGLRIVQDNMEKASRLHLEKADIKMNIPKGCSPKRSIWFESIVTKELKDNEKIKNILSKYNTSGFITTSDIQRISDEDLAVILEEIPIAFTNKLKGMAQNPDFDEINKIVQNLRYFSRDCGDILDEKTLDYLRTLKDFSLIVPEDIQKPRYIFDRHSELAQNTLGESIVEMGKYKGHWVDKEYLDTADFMQILGTWIHEVCHKSGGDGSSDFTYALTDMLRVLLRSGSSAENCTRLSVLEEIFNKL